MAVHSIGKTLTVICAIITLGELAQARDSVTISSASGTTLSYGLNQVKFTGSCSPANSGIMMSLNDGNWDTTICGPKGTYTYIFDLSGQYNGSYSIGAALTGPDNVTVTAKTKVTVLAPAVSLNQSLWNANLPPITLIDGTCAVSPVTLISGKTSLGSFGCSNGKFSGNINMSKMPDGAVTLTATNGKAPSIATDQISFNKVTPKITFDALPNNYLTSSFSSVTLTGQCTLDGTVKFNVGNAQLGSAVCQYGSWSATLDFTKVANGVMTLNANEVLGSNTGTGSIKWTKAVPTITIKTPVAKSIVNSNVTFSGTCNLEGAQIVVTDSGSQYDTQYGTCAKGAYTIPLNLVYAPDQSTVSINATLTSDSGATGVASVSVTKISPAISILVPSQKSTVSGNFTKTVVSGTCSYAAPVTVSLGTAKINTTCTGNKFSTTFDISRLPEGALTATANVAALTGGAGAASTVSFTKLTPTLKLTAPTAGAQVGDLIAVTGTCTVDGSMNVSFGNIQASGACASGGFNIPINITTAANGPGTLVATWTGGQGNQLTASAKVTKAAAVINLTAPVANSTVQNTFTAAGKCSGTGTLTFASGTTKLGTGACSNTGSFSVSLNAANLPDGWMPLSVYLGDISSAVSTSIWIVKNKATTKAPPQGDPLLTHAWYLKNTGQSALAQNGGTPGMDLNLTSTMAAGYTGKGVKVLVCDSGFESHHEDLSANFDFSSLSSRDYNSAVHANPLGPFQSQTGEPVADGDIHGTLVAGIIGAVANNGVGSHGVAPNVIFSSANAISESPNLNHGHAVDLDSLTGPWDIINNSWGAGSAQSLVPEAYDQYYVDGLKNTTKQRNGLGTIIVRSAGNDFAVSTQKHLGPIPIGPPTVEIGDSNLYLFNHSPYTILVSALNAKGTITSYSSFGANIWVAGFGGEHGNTDPAMVTTDRMGCNLGFASTSFMQGVASMYQSYPLVWAFNTGLDPANKNCNYSTLMNGTSSAAPTVTGSIALMLEANPNLSWRDVKHIIATTAYKVDYLALPPGTPLGHYYSFVTHPLSGMNPTRYAIPAGAYWMRSWQTNGAGYLFHNFYGFGKMDVDAAIAMAKNYSSNLGTLNETRNPASAQNPEGAMIYDSGPINVPIPDNSSTYATSTINVDHNFIIEAVQVVPSVSHPDISELQLSLFSPSGANMLVLPGDNSLAGRNSYYGAPFLVNGFYGESSLGQWTLKVRDFRAGNVGAITGWKINIFGHKAPNVTPIIPTAPTNLLLQANSSTTAQTPLVTFTPSASGNTIRYEASIGSAPGLTDVLGWSASGDDGSEGFTFSGLNLKHGDSYYYNIRAVSNTEDCSPVVSSAAWTVP